MADACNCLTCQVTTMLKAEAERRGGTVEATEIIGLAVDLLAAVMHGVAPEGRKALAFGTSLALAIRLKQLDEAAAGSGVVPTHEPEARVQ